MSYSVDLRERVVAFVEAGGAKALISQTFFSLIPILKSDWRLSRLGRTKVKPNKSL